MVLGQEEASISGVIFIVIREKAVLAVDIWLPGTLPLEEADFRHSSFFLGLYPPHQNRFSISVSLTCHFLLKRGDS